MGTTRLARNAARLAVLTALVVGIGGPPPWARAQGEVDGFGRWEQGLRRCRIERFPPGGAAVSGAPPGANAAQNCQRLRLDQQLEGLLVVRWVSGAAGGRFASRQLVFAGLLDQASPPLRCNPEGACRPVGAMAVWVSLVAESGFDPRGLALGLPSSRRVQGLCRLEARHFHCEASATDGIRWRAEGSL
ncbi:hypothetical protein NZK33_10355 [Cyanobium sp. FGCU-6]|nr:hypothetical protein [Cyanobium sp. FGCU6]